MDDLGFWNFARRDPGQLALVDPEGREWTRGELLARCNQLVHGLRALGLVKGDCVATVLPNGAVVAYGTPPDPSGANVQPALPPVHSWVR